MSFDVNADIRQAIEDSKKPLDYVPYVSIPAPRNACVRCPNHPSNGGSGIRHCILGSIPVTC